MRTLLVATNNRSKGAEMKRILRSLLRTDWDVVLLPDFGEFPEPEETGETYSQNALIKAEAAMRQTGEICIADDAGLEIDALDGAPGVHSKRFNGAGTSFKNKMDRVLELMKDVANEHRTARFNCWVAVAVPGQRSQLFHAEREGMIAREPHGEGGFGYDPIFFLTDLGRTMAELSPAEKDATSHRGKVLRAAAQFINTL